MTDEEIIKEAYEDTVKNLFEVFFGACVIAKNKKTRNEAEERFMVGARTAREVRDRALVLLNEK